MTTKDKKVVTIEVQKTGVNFGCFGVVKALNHHVLHTTRVFPHGCTAQAREAAEGIAEAHGYTIHCTWAD